MDRSGWSSSIMDEDEEAYFEGDEDEEDTENENVNDGGPSMPLPRARPNMDPYGDGDMDHLLNGKGRPPLTQRKSIEFVRAPLSLSLSGSNAATTNSPLVDYPLEEDDDALEQLSRKRDSEGGAISTSPANKPLFPNPILSTPPRERKPPPSSGRVTPSKRTSSDREFELEETADVGESPVTPEEVNMMDIEPKGKRSRAS